MASDSNLNDVKNTNNSNPITTSEGNRSGNQYTAEQDSNYARDSKLGFNFLYWLKKSIASTDQEWQIYKQEALRTPQDNLTESFARMPKNIFEPTGTEIVQRQITMQDALSIPTISTFRGGVGLTVGLRDIGLFLGLVEDTSPEINYVLNYTCDVEIVIYSINAQIIATIFAGTQKQGKYKITWNGKDDNGKNMPHGDYIAEVRIGTERFVRKRIVIGGY